MTFKVGDVVYVKTKILEEMDSDGDVLVELAYKNNLDQCSFYVHHKNIFHKEDISSD